MDNKIEEAYKETAKAATALSACIHKLSGITTKDGKLVVEDNRIITPFNNAQTSLQETMHWIRDIMDVHADDENREQAATSALETGNIKIIE